MTQLKVARNYKDGIFRTMFSDKESLAELYEALSGEKTNADAIELRTIEDVVYATLKNDVAFTVGDKVIVCLEHMSTVNFNLPLRMLSYVSKILEGMSMKRGFYQRKKSPLPRPNFYIFYNGLESRPKQETLCLSDSFSEGEEDPALELKVKVINVNFEMGAELLQKSKKLNLYSRIVSRSRELLSQGLPLEKAMAQVERELQTDEDGQKFFATYGLGGIKMLFEELTEEEYREIITDEAREEGMEKGVKKGRKEGMKKGRQQGREEERREMAINMKKEGIPLETIMKVTGLSQAEVETL